MQTCYCPSCGEKLTIPDTSRSYMFCQHCGTKIDLAPRAAHSTTTKTEHTERYVDEADLQRAKNEDRVIGVFAAETEEYRAQKDHDRRMESDSLHLQAEIHRLKLEDERNKREQNERVFHDLLGIGGFVFCMLFLLLMLFTPFSLS